MTGIESKVYNMLADEDISWIPVNRSLSLIDAIDPSEEWMPLLNEIKEVTERKCHEIKSKVVQA